MILVPELQEILAQRTCQTFNLRPRNSRQATRNANLTLNLDLGNTIGTTEYAKIATPGAATRGRKYNAKLS